MRDLEDVKKRLDVTGKGVYVQASTLGSLEALLEFLKSVHVRLFVLCLVHTHDAFGSPYFCVSSDCC